MAQRKKKKKNKKRFDYKSWSPSERWRKIIGVFVGAFSLYLGLAYLSYATSWKADQAQIYQFEWGHFIAGDLPIINLTGRLGSILSHQIIYWGFGLPSISFVILGFKYAYELWRGVNWYSTLKFTFYTILITAFTSVVFDFTFSNSTFPWGGAFGESMQIWLSNFLGDIGLFFLILAIVIAYFIWLFNPKMKPIPVKKWLRWMQDEDEESLAVSDDKNEPNKETDASQSSSEKEDYDGQKTKEKIESPEPSPIQSNDSSSSLENQENQTAQEENVEDERLKVDLTPDTSTTKEDLSKDEKVLEVEISTEGMDTPEINVQEEDRGNINDLYDPTAELSHYNNPPLDLLQQHDDGNISIDKEELEHKKKQIIKTLYNYKIEITKIRATIGPTVTLYEIVPAPGVRISKIKNLEDDIALSLSALGIGIIAPIPGRGTIGIEVPNKNKQIVSLREVLEDPKYDRAKMELPIAIGKDISNKVFIADLAKMPHLLIAGATGQGKSVGLNAILTSLLYCKHPAEVKFILVDPKKVELTLFNKIERHYLAKLPDTEEAIITDNTKVINTLNSLCIEMDNRYELLKDAMVRNIKEYNTKFKARKLNPEQGHKFLPYIVLVIDEFADLIMTAGKEVETPIARLAQLARAIGIHLIIATQRPSVNVITGIIKANFPARIAFRVTSKIDSRTILDAQGADQLIGRGDMLYTQGNDVTRLQCAFVDTPEVAKITDYIGSQRAYPEAHELPEYVGEESGTSLDNDIADRDAMFRDAAEVIVTAQQGSASLIQRKLKLGYNRAGRIVDQLEAAGIVGPFEGSKARQVLIPDEYALDLLLENEIK